MHQTPPGTAKSSTLPWTPNTKEHGTIRNIVNIEFSSLSYFLISACSALTRTSYSRTRSCLDLNITIDVLMVVVRIAGEVAALCNRTIYRFCFWWLLVLNYKETSVTLVTVTGIWWWEEKKWRENIGVYTCRWSHPRSRTPFKLGQEIFEWARIITTTVHVKVRQVHAMQAGSCAGAARNTGHSGVLSRSMEVQMW